MAKLIFLAAITPVFSLMTPKKNIWYAALVLD